MKGDPQFVILKHQAWMKSANFEDTILGAIVKEPLSPTTNYVPQSPGLSHCVQDGSATDFSIDGAGSKSNEFVASLTSIGNVKVSANKEDSLHLAGKYVRFKRIQQLEQFWADFKEDTNIKTIVPKWVKCQGDWPVCLVVGIMICEDVEYCTDVEESSQRQASGEVPIGHVVLASTGVNIGHVVDPKLSADSTKYAATAFRAKMGESSIFAVELKIVTTAWFSQRLALKEDGPKFDRTRLAGTESSEEEDEEDRPIALKDLILEDLDADTIKDMTK
ncbi:uncharacterized protein M421DRAFT_424354 [Didymella exigua CBS 183.55]|uniref:Uncharacterized protein n=1 Tax=Didymella exigua CBS 183.55 TaxID=1150837 RepID=A0A6A5RH52_9PLEO|nr:uncharacterized protein M421DRAFT_424354 [Didymella exigua CBS 183.55]KAF1924937.1 hypothetical protein M421DRAFT_424354 [Didymella exigua CBS 183.55]